MSSLKTQLQNTAKRQQNALSDTQNQMTEAQTLPKNDTTNTLIHRINLRIKSQTAALEQTQLHLKAVEAAESAQVKKPK